MKLHPRMGALLLALGIILGGVFMQRSLDTWEEKHPERKKWISVNVIEVLADTAASVAGGLLIYSIVNETNIVNLFSNKSK